MNYYFNRFFLSVFFIAGIVASLLAQKTNSIPLTNKKNTKVDWLVTSTKQKAQIIEEGDNITLDNGLVKRGFRIAPNLVCTDYTNLTNGQQLLRAVKPEAKIVLDGKEYTIGGLQGQKENAYLLPEWLDKMKVGNEDFVLVNHHVTDIQPFLRWKPTTWLTPQAPAKGKQLVLEFESPLF